MPPRVASSKKAKSRVAKSVPAESSARPWPAASVELWGLDRLVPYARNARTHTEKQVDQLAASIKEWGWTNPVLVDEKGNIIAGHGRVLAAKKLELTQVPVMIARGWSEAQKRAYLLADNKLPLNAGWDDLNLGAELQDLKTLGADLSLIGFSDKEIAKFFPDAAAIAAEMDAQLESAYQVLIECKDETEQLQILERLQRDGVKCRALIA